MASSPAAIAEPGSAMPFQRSSGSAGGAGRRRRLAAAAGQRDDIVVGAAHGVAGGIGIIGRPLAAGALAQHAAQAEENEHRQRQENDGVDVEHVALAFGCRDRTTGIVGQPADEQSAERKSVPALLCKHATELIQWLAPNSRRRSLKGGP